MAQQQQQYSPLAFLDEQALQLYAHIKNAEEPVAVEMIKLHLRLSYQQGYAKGLEKR